LVVPRSIPMIFAIFKILDNRNVQEICRSLNQEILSVLYSKA